MSNNKLLETLGYLDSKQRKSLKLFIASPYFNNKSNATQITDLLTIIIKNKAKNTSPNLEKRKLQKRFFPGIPFVEKSKNVIDALASEANKLVEKFIVYEELEEEIAKKSAYALGKFFYNRGNNHRFWPIIDKFKKQSKKKIEHHTQNYFLNFQIEELAASFSSYFDPKSYKENLNNADTALDKAFFAKKLEFGIFLCFSNINSSGSNSFNKEFHEYIQEVYPKNVAIHSVIGDIYYSAIQAFQHPKDTTHLKKFKDISDKNKENIPTANISVIQALYRYFYGRNYKLSGDTALSTKLVTLYKEHLEKGYFFYFGNKMYLTTLKLLVNFGIKQKEFSWVEHILKLISPSKIIGTKYPDEIHSLCTAELLFAKQQYEAAESHIEYRLFEDFNFSLSCDILLIKIYFETQNELLESRIRAMELKVRRAKIQDFDKQSYLNFISIVRQTDKYKWVKNTEKLESLDEKTKSDEPLIQREWLQKIINE